VTPLALPSSSATLNEVFVNAYVIGADEKYLMAVFCKTRGDRSSLIGYTLPRFMFGA
jgi:hypothetical protein